MANGRGWANTDGYYGRNHGHGGRGGHGGHGGRGGRGGHQGRNQKITSVGARKTKLKFARSAKIFFVDFNIKQRV